MDKSEIDYLVDAAEKAVEVYAKKKHGLPVSYAEQIQYQHGTLKKDRVEASLVHLLDMPSHHDFMENVTTTVRGLLETHQQELTNDRETNRKAIEETVKRLYDKAIGKHADSQRRKVAQLSPDEIFSNSLNAAKHPKPEKLLSLRSVFRRRPGSRSGDSSGEPSL